ncbi:MAG TPA: beta-propeller fold lactonase family protein [Blastocatellia bacterium]|nr:beta-propeller fold lactonase family protein [Blastocatellia bacterium]
MMRRIAMPGIAIFVLFLALEAGVQAQSRFAYVADNGSGSVSAYTINPATGALMIAPGSPLPSGADPFSIALDPFNRFVYVGNGTAGPAGIWAFKVNSATGSLTLVPGSPFPAPDPGNAYNLSVDPSGRFLFAANGTFAEGSVSAFTIDARTGALTAIPGSPFPTGGQQSVGAVVHPNGRFLYVENIFTSNVSAFSIDPNTGILSLIPGSPFASGSTPNGIAMDPLGRFLITANFDFPPGSQGGVSVFKIDTNSGALSNVPGSPFSTSGMNSSSAAVDATGQFVYVGNQGSATVDGFSLNGATGFLTPVPGSPFATGNTPLSLSAEPAGMFLYEVGEGANAVYGYSIDPATGTLIPVPGSPFGGVTGPWSIATGATNFCLRDNQSNNLLQFNPATGAYRFTRCSDGLSLSGTGQVESVSGVVTLTDTQPGYRIRASFNPGQSTGSANIVLVVSQGVFETIRINDTNPNSVCSCT